MIWALFLLTQVLGEIESHSFKSPLIPSHSEKFNTYGEAIPMRKFVRLHPPKQSSSGSLLTSSPLTLQSFEIEIVINCGSNSDSDNTGASLWFSNTNYHLGEIYGLSSEFQGLALIINTKQNSLYLVESYENLNFDKINSSPRCDLYSSNKQIALHLKITENKFEV